MYGLLCIFAFLLITINRSVDHISFKYRPSVELKGGSLTAVINPTIVSTFKIAGPYQVDVYFEGKEQKGRKISILNARIEVADKSGSEKILYQIANKKEILVSKQGFLLREKFENQRYYSGGLTLFKNIELDQNKLLLQLIIKDQNQVKEVEFKFYPDHRSVPISWRSFAESIL